MAKVKLKVDYTKSKGASKEEMDNVAAWQQRRGLTVDGVWGKNTQAAYEKEQSAKPSNNSKIKIKPNEGSLTDTTRNQIVTPNKVLQKEEQSKKDFNNRLEQARLKAAASTKAGSMGDSNNPNVKAYRELLKQKPLSGKDQSQITDTKNSVDPANMAITAASMLALGGAIKYGSKYAQPLLKKVPFTKILDRLKMSKKIITPSQTAQMSSAEYDAVRSQQYKELLDKRPQLNVRQKQRIANTLNQQLVPTRRGLLLEQNNGLSSENLKKQAKNIALSDMEKEGIEVSNRLKFKKK